MKKTFLSVALLSTMALSMPLSFTSCKDYDDDITEINGTTDDLQNQLKTIQAAIDSNKAIADAAKAAADASAKAAQEAAEKGDKAAEEAQKAMAIANEAKAAAAEAKAEALAEIAAQLQAADAKNQEQFKAILSRLEGVESKLSGLDADQIDKAIQAVEAIQVQLKAFEKYNTLLDQLAAYPALIQDVKDAKANIESLTGRVKAAEDAIKANAEAANKALEDLSKEINGKLSTGINTIAGVIAQRLTSVTLIPDLYVGGIPTIAFESAKYNSLQLVDGEWKVTANSKVYAIHNGETTAQYRLNPGNVGAEDVVMDELGFVSKIAVSRADEAVNDVVAYVPGSGKVDANGVLTVNLTKPVSNSGSLNFNDNRIYTVSLRVPIAKKHLFDNEGAAFVYSEYTRVEETYFQPELFATPKVLEAAGSHFADSTTIYNSTVGQMVGYKLCYKDQLDLNELVQGCAFVADRDPNAAGTHTPMTLEKLKSYGFNVVFSIAKGKYEPNTEDKTNQQAFAKLDGTTLTPIVPTGAGDNQASIGKEPIIHILLVDTKNNTVVDSRYVKIQYTKEKMTPLPFTVATFNENLSCKDSYVFTVTWQQMMDNALSKYPTNGISKHDFLAIYGKHASEKVVTVDGVKNTTLVNNITDYVELGDNDQATPVMSFTLTNAEIGALAQTKTKAYVVTLTYTDPKGLNPDVVITFNVNITNNIASPTLGATDATKWVNETMLLYPIPYGTQGVSVANYNTNILQGRSNPLVKGLLDCGEWSFNLTGKGSDVATMKVKAGSLVDNALGLWMSKAMAENLTETYVAIPHNADGIALVEAATKLTVTWKARLNGLAANTVNFGTSYLQIVKPLKDPVLDNSKELSDNSSTQEIPSLMALFSLKDAYNQTVANTSGMPKNLWSYYEVGTVKFGNIGNRTIMITDNVQGANPRSLASLHMSANVDANTTKLTFKNEGAPLQNDCYLQIPVQVSHRWGVLSGTLYVKIKHVLSQN